MQTKQVILIQLEDVLCNFSECLFDMIAKSFQFKNRHTMPFANSADMASFLFNHSSPDKPLASRDQYSQFSTFFSKPETFDTLFESLKPIPFGADSIQKMKLFPNQQFQVYLFTFSNYTIYINNKCIDLLKPACQIKVLNLKMNFICNVIGVEWLQRLIILPSYSHDNMKMLSMTSFIHSNNNDNASSHLVISTLALNNKCILFNFKDFNDSHSNFQRLTCWRDWKTAIQYDDVKLLVDAGKIIAIFRHGSHDSKDVDLMYAFSSQVSNYNDYLTFTTGAASKEDRNIVVIDSKMGVVSTGFRASNDELNNGIMCTFHLHLQTCENPVKKKIKRLVLLKSITTILSVLLKVRKLTCRDAILSVIHTKHLNELKSVFASLNFEQLIEEMSVEEIKFVAFRIGMCLALVMGHELFTKQTVSQYLPQLEAMIYRRTSKETSKEHGRVLNQVKEMFLKELQRIKPIVLGDLHLFDLDLNSNVINHAELQCHALLIDTRYDALLHYALDYGTLNVKLVKEADWPMDTVQPNQCCSSVDALNIHKMVRIFKFDELESSAKSRTAKEKHKLVRFKHLVIMGMIEFVNETVAETKQMLDSNEKIAKVITEQLQFEKYFYTFYLDKNEIKIVAKRSRITYLLEQDIEVFV